MTACTRLPPMLETDPLPPLPPITPGLYEHYKGMRYQVHGVARHSETLEPLVIYRALYGEAALWVRPYEMFMGNVVINDVNKPRFALIEPQDLSGP
jgi:hypothetical protein